MSDRHLFIFFYFFVFYLFIYLFIIIIFFFFCLPFFRIFHIYGIFLQKNCKKLGESCFVYIASLSPLAWILDHKTVYVYVRTSQSKACVLSLNTKVIVFLNSVYSLKFRFKIQEKNQMCDFYTFNILYLFIF